MWHASVTLDFVRVTFASHSLFCFSVATLKASIVFRHLLKRPLYCHLSSTANFPAECRVVSSHFTSVR